MSITVPIGSKLNLGITKIYLRNISKKLGDNSEKVEENKTKNIFQSSYTHDFMAATFSTVKL